VARLLSVKDLAKYLGLSERTVYKMVKAGDIPVLRIGGQFRFRQEQIDEWLKSGPGKTPDFALSRIENTKDQLTRRLLFVALLTKALEPERIRPVIVGGNAVEFYTAGGYTTGDIDVVAPSEPIDKVLARWGFRKQGRHWISEKLDIFIEAPSSSLNKEQMERVSEVEIDDLKVYVLGIEDLIIDRLNACVHWKSSDDGRWAKELMALHAGEIDWTYLEDRTKEEETHNVFRQTKKDLGLDEENQI